MDKCPVTSKNSHEEPNDASSSCKGINPATNLPYAEDLSKRTDQVKLDNSRVESSIPRTDCQENWLYPSDQMFYNALKRKGKEADPKYISDMVDVHNFLNEGVWNEIVQWERTLHPDCEPRLKSFRGRPDALSPKARFFTWFGVAPPFDRHDWIIDRCGQEVRYIIDYYSGHKIEGQASFSVDIRPAVDSAGALLDRFKKSYKEILNKNSKLH